jgi:hypothetical protein
MQISPRARWLLVALLIFVLVFLVVLLAVFNAAASRQSVRAANEAGMPAILAALTNRTAPRGPGPAPAAPLVGLNYVDERAVRLGAAEGFRVLTHHSFGYRAPVGFVGSGGLATLYAAPCGPWARAFVDGQARTQNWTIAEQVARGVTAFDVRASRQGGRIVVDHGAIFGDLDALLDDFAAAVRAARPTAPLDVLVRASAYATGAAALPFEDLRAAVEARLAPLRAEGFAIAVRAIPYIPYVQTDDIEELRALIKRSAGGSVQAILTPEPVGLVALNVGLSAGLALLLCTAARVLYKRRAAAKEELADLERGAEAELEEAGRDIEKSVKGVTARWEEKGHREGPEERLARGG